MNEMSEKIWERAKELYANRGKRKQMDAENLECCSYPTRRRWRKKAFMELYDGK